MRGHVMITIQEATMFGTQTKDFSPCKFSIDNKPILLKPIAAKGW
jgi:hypothetical protein